MIAMEVGDIMMAIKDLLFLILFFQYYTFLEEKQNENTEMTIHHSLCKLFWSKGNGPVPLAQVDDGCTVSFLLCDTRIKWRDSGRSES